MGLLGSSWEDPQSSAIMALAGGLLRGDFGGGLLGANQAYTDAKQNALKQKFMDMQMQNYASEIEARKLATIKDQRQQKMMESFFPGMLGDSGAPAAAPGQAPAGAAPGAMPGAPGAAPQGGNDILALSQRLGIPPQAIQADIVFNGGKKISELLDKHGSRDMQVTNGYAYDKNNVGPGFMPFLNTSQSGQTSMGRIDQQTGLPVVSAPQGAVETYDAYNRTAAASKPIKVFNPATQREEYTSEAAVTAPGRTAPQPQGMPQPVQGATGNFVGDPAQVMEAITKIRDPQERANAMAAFQEQAKRTRGFAEGQGFAAGPSAGEAATSAANKAYAEGTAKDTVDQRKSIMQADFSAPTNIAKYQQIGKLLEGVDGGKFTPAGYEVASALNSMGLKVNPKLGNVQAAQAMANEVALQLRSPAGGAGMPGALSDKDREFLVSMTPNMAQSAEGRKQVIDSYIAVQQRNQQVAKFARNYEKKYGRLDNGFFDQLSAWSNANSMFGSR